MGAVRQTQEREAKQKMREKAKELQRQKMEAQKRGAKGGPSISSSSSYGGSGGFASGPSVGDTLSTPAEPPNPTVNSSMRKPISNKAMKLGGKSKDVEGFVDQLMQEGQHVASLDN